MAAWPELRIRHVLPQRVRLQWSADLPLRQIDALCQDLELQSWLCSWQRRDRSRSLVLRLGADCPELRWQLAITALGWQLRAADPPPPSAASRAWLQTSTQIGASMVGSIAGQLLLGGFGGALGLLWMGPRGALILASFGTVLGAAAGSVAGSAWAEGRTADLRQQLAPRTWHRLGARLGEEAGSSTGRIVGLALAGPIGGVAGLAVGSLIGTQLVSDLTNVSGHAPAVGQPGWFAQIAREGGRDAVSEQLGRRIGGAISGGSVIGRELGASLGVKFSHAIDWSTSVQQHRLLPKPVISSRLQSSETEGFDA